MEKKQFIKSILLGLLMLAARHTASAQVFDAVVAKDGTGNFSTVQDAINAAPDSAATPWLILVKNGEYDELVYIPARKTHIHLIGQDPLKTIIRHTIHCGSEDDVFFRYSVNNSSSPNYKRRSVFEVAASDFYSENITFQNTYGTSRQSGPQALAMSTMGDRQAFCNCRFRSFQDTWFTATDDHVRQYARDCWIEGAVDYLYGGGNILVERSTFYNVRGGSVITAPSHINAPYGYVIKDCVVDGNAQAADGHQKLGRPWHDNPVTVYINTTMRIPIAPEGWSDMGTVPRLFAEYGSRDKDGNLIDLSKRKSHYTFTRKNESQTGEVTEEKVSGSCPTSITEEEAARYTYEKMISAPDGWNPRQYMEELPATKRVRLSKSGILRWEPVEGAIGYLVINSNEKIVAISSKCVADVADTDKSYTVRAVSPYGHLGTPATFHHK